MRYKRLILITLFLFAFGITGIQAQENINATGSNASSYAGSVSYSVGQIVYQTKTGTDGSVAEGVQQPYEISVVTALEEAKSIDLVISAYPNPTSDFLILNIEELDISGLSYQIFNIMGELLKSEKIISNRTSIEMRDLLASVYFVRVLRNNMEIKVFKIIKN